MPMPWQYHFKKFTLFNSNKSNKLPLVTKDTRTHKHMYVMVNRNRTQKWQPPNMSQYFPFIASLFLTGATWLLLACWYGFSPTVLLVMQHSKMFFQFSFALWHPSKAVNTRLTLRTAMYRAKHHDWPDRMGSKPRGGMRDLGSRSQGGVML